MTSALPRLRPLTAALALVALLAALVALPQQAATSAVRLVQDPDRNSHAVTGWGWHTSATPAQINAYVDQGNRIVDLELTSSSPKFSVSYVANAGTYKRGWWWYFGKSGAQVKNLLSQNKARLIDIEPYQTANGTRYAVVMVKNSGSAKKTWGWHYNVPLSTVTSYASNNNLRVIDVDRHANNRFSAIYIKNTGVDKKGWWHYYNVTAAKVGQLLDQKGARPIQLERISSTRFDVVMQRVSSGDYWYWYYNLTGTQLTRITDQYGLRIFQVKSRVVNGTRRYDALLLNNSDAENSRIRNLVDDKMTGSWGFYLKRIGSSERLAMGASNVFEPASMIKIVHAVTAMREIQNSPTVDENTNVTWYAHPSFPAQHPGDPGYRTASNTDTDHADVCPYNNAGTLLTSQAYVDDLGPDIIAQTLEQSDNRTTDALARRYGFSGLNATKTLAGMTSSKVNHRIGCNGKASPQPVTHNQLTLRDAGKIYERVQNGTLLDSEHRDLLYGYMIDGPIGTGSLRNMIIAEATAAGLTVSERNAFVARVKTVSKGGSYGYCPNFDGTGTCNPPTVHSRTVGGVIWLPFKSSVLGGIILDSPYTYGRYWDGQVNCGWTTVANGNCTAFNNNQSAMGTVSVEMFRAEVKKALATW